MKRTSLMQMAESQQFSDMKALGFQHITTTVDQSYAEIIAGRNGERNVFPTKWVRLNDHLLGGLQPGKMYTIGGRPGSGKSALSNQMIFDMLDHPKNQNKLIVLYWSFEMPGYQQLLRIGSAKSGKTLRELLSVRDRLDDTSFTQYCALLNPYKKYPIYFNNNAQRVDHVHKISKRVQALFPTKTIVNLFDHSRLFKKSKEESELQMLTELSHMLIELQQEIHCIDIMLSQLNRNIEQPSRAEQQFQPMLSDLFGADSIGQDSECVMMINRPNDMYGLTAPYLGQDPVGLLALHIEKNRAGQLGMLPFDADLKIFSIKEREFKNQIQ